MSTVTPIRPGAEVGSSAQDDKPMPSRQTVEARLEDARIHMYRTRSLIEVVARRVDLEQEEIDELERHHLWNALQVVKDLIDEAADQLEPVVILETDG